jgi:hypothetical protein
MHRVVDRLVGWLVGGRELALTGSGISSREMIPAGSMRAATHSKTVD